MMSLYILNDKQYITPGKISTCFSQIFLNGILLFIAEMEQITESPSETSEC